MKRDEIIRTLKEREAELRARGVTHAALFGSVARDEQRPDSDIDIVVDLDPAVVATMFDYAGLKDSRQPVSRFRRRDRPGSLEAAPSTPRGGRRDLCFLTSSATRWRSAISEA